MRKKRPKSKNLFNDAFSLKNHKGLSAIVATLIIILIALVAVVIVWVAVNNIIQRGAEQIETGQFTLDLQIKAAQVQNGNITVVVVRRNPGEGEFVGMNFVFSDGQNSETIREDTVLNELEERSFTFTLTNISTTNLKTISVVPIFEIGGKESMGNVADEFDVKKGGSIATGGAVTPGEGNFAKYGPVGEGYAEYKVSGGGDFPQFKGVIIDPLDVHLGENQTFTARVYSPYNITEVTTNTQLDTQILNLPLEKIGTDAEGVETWSAIWNVYDTHSNTYRTSFIARDSLGNVNTVDLTWTDPCSGLTHGASSTLLDNCTVSQVDGLDTGNITIPTGKTLTLNSGGTFAWTPGYSIILSGGKIALGSGGSLKKGYLFYYDGDTDLYSNNGTLVFDTSSTKTGFSRAKDVTSTSDCNDASVNVQVTRTQYTDSDGDGYNGSTGSSFCASAGLYSNSACTTAGSTFAKNSTGGCRLVSSLGSDCCDSDANAKPGQTSYYTTARSGCGGYDYNCVSGEEKNVTSAVQSCAGASCPSCSASPTATPACGQNYNQVSCQCTDICEDLGGGSTKTVGCR